MNLYSYGVRKTLGVVLIALSVVLGGFWSLAMFADFSPGEKGSITLVTLVAGEIAFWLGVTLLGREIWDRFKALFNPANWRKRPGHAPDAAE